MLIATVGVIGLYPGGLPKTCNKWVKDPFFERDPKKPSWSTVYSVLAGPKLYLQMLESAWNVYWGQERHGSARKIRDFSRGSFFKPSHRVCVFLDILLFWHVCCQMIRRLLCHDGSIFSNLNDTNPALHDQVFCEGGSADMKMAMTWFVRRIELNEIEHTDSWD